MPDDLTVLQSEYDDQHTPYAYPYIDEDYRYLKTLVRPRDQELDERAREELKYTNTNGKMDEVEMHVRTRTTNNPWTDEERGTFLQMFLDFPKEFGRIASFIPNKSSQDCVLYYYLNKKSLKLKALAKQALNIRNKRRRRQVADQDGADPMLESATSVKTLTDATASVAE